MNKAKVEDIVAEKLYWCGPDTALKEIKKLFNTPEEQIWAGIVFGMRYSSSVEEMF